MVAYELRAEPSNLRWSNDERPWWSYTNIIGRETVDSGSGRSMRFWPATGRYVVLMRLPSSVVALAVVCSWCDAGGVSWRAGNERPYFVAGPDGSGEVEAWSGYPLQFGGQRRFGWQDAMAAELREALGRLPAVPGAVLAGRYLSTDQSPCDVENRLFTNLGTSSFPKGLAAIRFERGADPMPPPPVPVTSVAGHLYLLLLPPGRDVAVVGACPAAGPLEPGNPPHRR